MEIPLSEWLEYLRTAYDDFGYAIVFLSALIENTALLGLFLPGNSFVLLGAFYARQGTLNLGLVIALASLGTVLGYHVDYLLGRYVVGSMADKWSQSSLGKRMRLAGRMRLARAYLGKYGAVAIMVSHLIGHIRSFVAIAAGMTHMRYRTFLIAEIVAATIWNTIYGLIGYWLGTQADQIGHFMQRFGIISAIIVIALIILWSQFQKRIKRRLLLKRYARKQAAQPDCRSHPKSRSV
ncbi:alkaline phosphatase [Dictyobacter alpinus]|uniref:Alkaline phosphatase n=1 Tax=Dictyobacter alpinus TaxID=2014873 RepID=A0A402BCH2_9CHLR|nr:DedA family protein [Dictyobacter alpinus]GCE29026.1 alkaline phosphatase [Dictyobacter alpinus]